VWTPIFFAPVGAVVYFWIGRDFSFERFRKDMPDRFYHGLVLPNLLVNWVLWIPVTFAIHAFPTPLQIQLSGLAAALFSLMLQARQWLNKANENAAINDIKIIQKRPTHNIE
jgi:uncharacterized membrane-anchored protein